jgi:hypothetical protein
MSAIKQIEELFDTLDRSNQLLVIEKLARRMRLGEIDQEEAARLAMELASEPNLNAPYPIPEGVYTERQLKPRGLTNRDEVGTREEGS